MKNCIKLVENIANDLHLVIQNQSGVSMIETPDYGWHNYRYTSDRFRLAHVEIFNQNKFCVIHCCVFPQINDPAPIYGFDVIAGENKITGMFMDLSPVVGSGFPFTSFQPQHRRDPPEWGGIFSEHWLACRPSYEEMELIGVEAVRVLTYYLTTLGSVSDPELVKQGQNRYCINQQQNEHTRKALLNLLGIHGANKFMSEILFPVIA